MESQPASHSRGQEYPAQLDLKGSSKKSLLVFLDWVTVKNFHRFLHQFLFGGKEPSPVPFSVLSRSKEPSSVYFTVYFQKSNSCPGVPFLEYFLDFFLPIFSFFLPVFLDFSRRKNLTSVYFTVYFRSKNLTLVFFMIYFSKSKYRPNDSVVGLYR